MQEISKLEIELLGLIEKSDNPSEILKSSKIKQLYNQLIKLPPNERSQFGKEINDLKTRLLWAIDERQNIISQVSIEPIDVTAPIGINQPYASLDTAEYGSLHPINVELDEIIDIFTRMGFSAVQSRQIDNDFNMFTSLNFPINHPARDSYDTFRTEEGFIPPAHTSTMQHRILKSQKSNLDLGHEVAAISYGRVFRNEDTDATHEHTFYQVEGVYVSKTASLANMLAVLKQFFETYYDQELKIKTQPSYFPFVEPGLEFAIEKPASLGGKPGQWLEMLGCGMIHPNVLKMADIDPSQFRGFAWGGGVERLVMLKYGIEDLRLFESARLKFLRKFGQ